MNRPGGARFAGPWKAAIVAAKAGAFGEGSVCGAPASPAGIETKETRDLKMRILTSAAGLLLAAFPLLAALAFAPPAAQAEEYYPWCLRGQPGGATTCSFESRAQCMVAAGGMGAVCMENAVPPPAGTHAAAVIDPMSASPGGGGITYYPWCARGGSSSATNCSFASRAQCVASAGGLGADCMKNEATPPPGSHTAVEVDPMSGSGSTRETEHYSPWCVRGGAMGSTTCTFDTKAQCVAAAGEIGSVCIENAAAPPVTTHAAVNAAPVPATPAPDTKRKPRREPPPQ